MGIADPSARSRKMMNNFEQPGIQGEDYSATIHLRINNYFLEKKAYLQHGYSLGKLSHAIDIPSHQLSKFINKYYRKNFRNLINGYRVGYLLTSDIVKEKFHQFTLDAIARDAGFRSRAAFISAVKKYTGMTPSKLFREKANLCA